MNANVLVFLFAFSRVYSRLSSPLPSLLRNRAVVPGASVRATNIGTSASFQSSTNAEGQYAIRTIPIGVYRLEVDAAGFNAYDPRILQFALRTTW